MARRFGSSLHVLHVEEPGAPSESDGVAAEEAIERAVETVADEGIDATTAVIESDEPVHQALIEYVTEHGIDCIVMGTQGRHGLDRFFLGSVAERTLREAPVPVMTVHEESDADEAIDRILIPTDGSDGADAAVEYGVELAAETDAEVHLIHVVESNVFDRYDELIDALEEGGRRTLERIADRDDLADLGRVETEVLTGRAHQSIAAYAAEHDVDCIVLGTHGRTGLSQRLLGSTTERVVRFANVPVLAVKAPTAEPSTVEYLDYDVLEKRGWALDDDNLFEKAQAADLDDEDYGRLRMGRDEYVLDAAESEGHGWPFHCRAGGCVNCAAVVTDGDLEMDVQRGLSEEEVEERDLRLTCVGSPTSDRVRLVYNAKRLDSLQDRVF